MGGIFRGYPATKLKLQRCTFWRTSLRKPASNEPKSRGPLKTSEKAIKAEPLKSFVRRGTRRRSAEDGNGKLMVMKNTTKAEQLRR